MRLKLLSYNIQVGILTTAYRGYLLSGWQHVLPTKNRLPNLDKIAQLIKEFDIVALQEVDAGSLRSQFINQTEYLAQKADFSYWHTQVNRNLGKIAQQSNAFLGHLAPISIKEYKLPTRVPGRGALALTFNLPNNKSLLVLMVHLALGKRTQQRQIKFIQDIIKSHQSVILMGDFNCQINNDNPRLKAQDLNLKSVVHSDTFPSWNPKRSLDHILVSENIKVHSSWVLSQQCSDHLPLAVEVEILN